MLKLNIPKSAFKRLLSDEPDGSVSVGGLLLDGSLAPKNGKPMADSRVLVNRKARKGRNPATGEEIMIPAKKVVKFRVARAAKDSILGVKK